ncbi:hypothetical protein RI129_002168 [Pyrocoelia pectoralis]|uniref:Uncharacterized protein n=1 Tax=Pyrocoelia pectoralis TaxID=417401 RepID=A0AAN7VKQ1_9COLE
MEIVCSNFSIVFFCRERAVKRNDSAKVSSKSVDGWNSYAQGGGATKSPDLTTPPWGDQIDSRRFVVGGPKRESNAQQFVLIRPTVRPQSALEFRKFEYRWRSNGGYRNFAASGVPLVLPGSTTREIWGRSHSDL